MECSRLDDCGVGEFGKAWANTKKPMIVIGSGVTESAAGGQVLASVARYVSGGKQKARFLSEEWNGVNVLQRVSNPHPPSQTHIHSSTGRPPPAPPHMTLATPPPPPKRHPSSSTYSTPTTSHPRRSPQAHLSSTRATTETSAPSSQMYVSPRQHTPKRAQRG